MPWFHEAACCRVRLSRRGSRSCGLRYADRLRIQPLAHSRPDMFGHNLSRRATVDDDAALRLFCGESLIGLAQPLVKLDRFSLEPVCGIVSTTALCARQTC